MEYIEAEPLPEGCQSCTDEDCDECDHAGERWVLSEVDELKLAKKVKERAIARFQRELDIINQKLSEYEK